MPPPRTPQSARARAPPPAPAGARSRRSRRARGRCRRSTQPIEPAPRARCGAGTRAHSAGDRVSALTAEISMATLMVTANWRNNWPDMPGMNAIGTNTDSSTSVIAMTGPVIWRIAFLVASPRRQIRLLLHHALDVLDHHDRVVDDDAHREHQRQQRDRVGGIAEREQHRERADQADRHRDGRDDGRAQAAEEQEHHDARPARTPRPAS